MRARIFSFLLTVLCLSRVVGGQTVSTAFTYQGDLSSTGTPINGFADFTFTLYDAANGGTQLVTPLIRNGTTVSNGIFTVSLDFGAGPFNGNARYIEVTNAQHFDAFLGFPGYPDRYVPLHGYLIQALNAMHAHLTAGTPLPPSQVVRTVPRGAGAPAITAANVPPIAAAPPVGDRIGYSRGTLQIPD